MTNLVFFLRSKCQGSPRVRPPQAKKALPLLEPSQKDWQIEKLVPGGAGFVMYAAFWIFVPAGDQTATTPAPGDGGGS